MTSLFSTARCSSSRNSLRGIHSITHHPVHILVAVLPPALMVFLNSITQKHDFSPVEIMLYLPGT